MNEPMLFQGVAAWRCTTTPVSARSTTARAVVLDWTVVWAAAGWAGGAWAAGCATWAAWGLGSCGACCAA